MRLLISDNYNAFTEEDNFNCCGVYAAIGNYKTNGVKPIYIGSSKNLRNRIFYTHIKKLDLGNHANPAFQSAWNKYNKNFNWFLLETCLPEDQFKREQYYLDLYKPFLKNKNGFNIVEQARGQGGFTFGSKHSDETKKRMSIQRSGENHPMFGRKHSLKSIENNKKSQNLLTFQIINPHGQVITFTNLSQFCRDNNFSKGTAYQLLRGKINFYRGWRKYHESLIGVIFDMNKVRKIKGVL